MNGDKSGEGEKTCRAPKSITSFDEEKNTENEKKWKW